MTKKSSVLVVVAHSDDQVLGPGGTIAKYVAEGKEVHTIIFSYGELSHPHFKREIIKKMRIEESQKADKLMGGSGVHFLGLSEGKFAEEFKANSTGLVLEKLFTEFKPEKIFTHALDDTLPDHKAVHRLVLKTYDKLVEKKKFKSSIYTFGVWRFFKFQGRNRPRLVVDISDQFDKKIDSLNVFKTQKVAMSVLTWSVYLKAITAGYKHHMHLAEEFYKLR